MSNVALPLVSHVNLDKLFKFLIFKFCVFEMKKNNTTFKSDVKVKQILKVSSSAFNA